MHRQGNAATTARQSENPRPKCCAMHLSNVMSVARVLNASPSLASAIKYNQHSTETLDKSRDTVYTPDIIAEIARTTI